MSPAPCFDNFEFCVQHLLRLGFKGNVLASKEVYDFLRGYLVEKTFKGNDDAYGRLWQMCQPAASQRQYLVLLTWQLGQIFALNGYRSDASGFHSLEM